MKYHGNQLFFIANKKYHSYKIKIGDVEGYIENVLKPCFSF